ncbi:hypothetical protein [Nostoc sp.]|uniref:hypothetical protein n=1 Tax=Nostoc sp. TaxID=1180 RepID=UPI002FF74091
MGLVLLDAIATPDRVLDAMPFNLNYKQVNTIQAQSLKCNIRSNLLPASSQILRSRTFNSGKV